MTRNRVDRRPAKRTASQRALDELVRSTAKLLHPDVEPRFPPKWPKPRKRIAATPRR